MAGLKLGAGASLLLQNEGPVLKSSSASSSIVANSSASKIYIEGYNNNIIKKNFICRPGLDLYRMLQKIKLVILSSANQVFVVPFLSSPHSPRSSGMSRTPRCMWGWRRTPARCWSFPSTGSADSWSCRGPWQAHSCCSPHTSIRPVIAHSVEGQQSLAGKISKLYSIVPGVRAVDTLQQKFLQMS